MKLRRRMVRHFWTQLRVPIFWRLSPRFLRLLAGNGSMYKTISPNIAHLAQVLKASLPTGFHMEAVVQPSQMTNKPRPDQHGRIKLEPLQLRSDADAGCEQYGPLCAPFGLGGVHKGLVSPLFLDSGNAELLL